MNKRVSLTPATCLALVAGTAITVGRVVAEETADDMSWITVQAPRVARQPIGRTPADAMAELVSITHRVSYAGLDLAMYADVMELEKRISESAQTACEQLAALRPLLDLDTPACVEQAVGGAMARAEKVIAAANRR